MFNTMLYTDNFVMVTCSRQIPPPPLTGGVSLVGSRSSNNKANRPLHLANHTKYQNRVFLFHSQPFSAH